MTAGLALNDQGATDTAEHDESELGAPLAGWWQRAGAFAIDVLCPLAAVYTVLLVIGAALDWPVGWAALILAIASLVVVAVNRWALPAFVGWSVGRSVTGIAVVDSASGEAPGFVRLLARDAAHLVDTLPFCLGWLWPLLDPRGRTFADKIVGTEVHQVPAVDPDRRTLAARLIGGATALSVVAALLGYALVYRHQQALDRARADIAQDGPQLVTDMLSYTVKTAEDDFSRAQSLVTEGYRPELVKQQDAVKKNGLVDNTYWVSNSAVLSSSQDRAAMLLLLQGQRGAGATQRFVTASVRAEYEHRAGRWLVSNLTVLTAPKPAAPPAPAESPAPEKPAPAKPAPAKPAKPEPEKPAPAKPAPAKPAPAKPSEGGR